MILFHHRAVEARFAKTGCRGWNRTSIRAFKGRCPTIRRPGIQEWMARLRVMRFAAATFAFGKSWWPARVTRPVLRIKSPLHHFNACRPRIGSPSRSSESEGWCSWQDSHPHWRRSRRRASSGWATRAEPGAPTRNCTGLAPIPKECIAQNALGAQQLVSPAGFSPATRRLGRAGSVI
jgi:hypothetical protein